MKRVIFTVVALLMVIGSGAGGTFAEEPGISAAPAQPAAAPSKQPSPVTLAELKLILEAALDGEWEAGPYLKGLVDLGPNARSATNTLYLIFPCAADDAEGGVAEGIVRAEKITENWNRPTEVVWTSDRWVVIGDGMSALKDEEVTAATKRLTDLLKGLVPKAVAAAATTQDSGKPKVDVVADEREISVELGVRKKPPTFAVNESIVIEARFVNRTDKPQVYRGGLGDKNIKSSCQIKLMAEGGKTWSARAAAAAAFANYKDIEVPAHGQTLIAEWDLSKFVYSEGSRWGAGGKILFADIARPGKYRVRWWDGVFQAGTPLRSEPVDFEIVQAATPPTAKPPQQLDLSVRQRLQRAIDVSRALAAKGQPINDESVGSLGLEGSEETDRDKPLLFPRTEDVEAYMRDRPWVSNYAPSPAVLRPMRLDLGDVERWPTQADAPELRTLLEDKAPAMRCMAAEALATLHQPEDVGRIGRLLKDDADGLPALGWNSLLTARPVGEEEIIAGGLHRMRSWHDRTVATTARLGLKVMTGENLTAKDFDKWWQRNSGGRECVWYWQQRLTRELAAVEALTIAAWQEDVKDVKSYEAKQERILAQQQQRFNAVRQAVAVELAQLPAEIEAKVRLAAINRYSTSLGVSLDEPLMGSFICPRMSSERLLELLDRKNLWEDVDWNNNCHYNNLVIQVVGRAELFFTREHLERLRAIMDREHGAVWWSGQVAFVVGISHLLPSAKTANLDDPNTRDGWLRSKMGSEGDLFVRGSLAAELVRVGLPENGDFLKKEFFAEAGWKDRTDIRQSILKALGEAPLTPPKREALLELVLDERFAPLWTQPNRAMGQDMYRQWAMRAVNAHAGKELLTDQDKYALTDPAKSEKALAEVLRKVATLQQPPAAGTTEIEERIFVPATGADTARLYLILTTPGNVRTWEIVVVRHAKEALAAISQYGGIDVNAVFFIRPTKESDTGAVSGFSLGQLKELIQLPDDKARLKVSEHAWSFGKKPEIGVNK